MTSHEASAHDATSDEATPPDSAGLRTGWTTGTCAAAAAKAAAIGLLTGTAPDEVDVELPIGGRPRFTVEIEAPNRCAVVKDAGDDPDCTDGARITAEVGFAENAVAGEGGVTLRNGPGVGTVTKPGLGLEVGGPAINKVPRRMITESVREVTDRAIVVTISVPDGEVMAEKTTNARLGIVGGISILGTRGTVKPFSTAAYRASVVQQVDVAAAQGETTMVLATGTRSDRGAHRIFGGIDEVAFVEVGDFTGIALRRAAGAGFERVNFVGMAGKITKLAGGVMMTHFHRSKVDTELLAGIAREAGADDDLVAAATETETARHFCERCIETGQTEPLRLLCERARDNCRAHVSDKLDVEVVMVDFDGAEVLARA